MRIDRIKGHDMAKKHREVTSFYYFCSLVWFGNKTAPVGLLGEPHHQFQIHNYNLD